MKVFGNKELKTMKFLIAGSSFDFLTVLFYQGSRLLLAPTILLRWNDQVKGSIYLEFSLLV